MQRSQAFDVHAPLCASSDDTNRLSDSHYHLVDRFPHRDGTGRLSMQSLHSQIPRGLPTLQFSWKRKQCPRLQQSMQSVTPRSMALHNRVSVEPYIASGSFPYLIHPCPALAAGRRPAVLHRDLLGLLHLARLPTLQAVSGHRERLLLKPLLPNERLLNPVRGLGLACGLLRDFDGAERS